jgi:hypothetical protein
MSAYVWHRRIKQIIHCMLNYLEGKANEDNKKVKKGKVVPVLN